MKQIFLLLLCTGLFACNEQQSLPAEKSSFSIDPVKAHIIEMNKTYSKRFTTNDSAFYAERYCADAEVYSPNMPAVKGREAIRNFFYNNGNNKEAIIELPTCSFYGGADCVVEDGTYSFPDGKGGSADKGKFIAIWKMEDGKWKLYREIWNSDITLKQ